MWTSEGQHANPYGSYYSSPCGVYTSEKVFLTAGVPRLLSLHSTQLTTKLQLLWSINGQSEKAPIDARLLRLRPCMMANVVVRQEPMPFAALPGLQIVRTECDCPIDRRGVDAHCSLTRRAECLPQLRSLNGQQPDLPSSLWEKHQYMATLAGHLGMALETSVQQGLNLTFGIVCHFLDKNASVEKFNAASGSQSEMHPYSRIGSADHFALSDALNMAISLRVISFARMHDDSLHFEGSHNASSAFHVQVNMSQLESHWLTSGRLFTEVTVMGKGGAPGTSTVIFPTIPLVFNVDSLVTMDWQMQRHLPLWVQCLIGMSISSLAVFLGCCCLKSRTKFKEL